MFKKLNFDSKLKLSFFYSWEFVNTNKCYDFTFFMKRVTIACEKILKGGKIDGK